jgi:hypothetical protein
LKPWQPQFEIRQRRLVPAAELLAHLWMEQGHEPIYRRALLEAGIVQTTIAHLTPPRGPEHD